ncbi:MAG: hypothetical protein WAL31_09415 [Gaiellaceae bacterium]
MRGLLALSCRAFPPEHRARRSDEVVDTALLAADGSAWRGGREAVSLVLAGLRQRLRAESGRSVRDGAALLAGALALVNLAVAVAGITAGLGRGVIYVHGLHGLSFGTFYGPYVIDWWWIAFTVAAAALVLGLMRGCRRLAIGAALVNLGLVGSDALFLANSNPYDGHGHFDVFTYAQTSSFPGGRQWLLASIVLAVATIATRPRRQPLSWLPLALVAAGVLVWLSRETWGAFFYLRWPLAAIVLLGVAFGAVAPRLAILSIGVVIAAASSVYAYLTASNLHHDPVETAIVAAGLAIGVLLPLAQLTRRRLT